VRRLGLLTAIAAVYVLVGKAALQSFAFVHASASPVWPGTGLALWALLLFGRRVWPAIFVASTSPLPAPC
jgi:integral membrane sensor domain MASE1